MTVFPIAEYRDRLLVAVRAGETPDMATLDQIWMAEFAASGAIIPLDDYLAASEVNPDDFFPGPGRPTSGTVRPGAFRSTTTWEEMYYNKAAFSAVGLDPEDPPSTWAELWRPARRSPMPPITTGSR